jgi:hypothetical protein
MVDLRPGPMVAETLPQALGMFDDRWWQWIVDFGLPGPDRGEGGPVPAALLAVLGVDLIMIVAFFGVVLSRRRWVSRQPGAFKARSGWWTRGAGAGPKWQRGYGR